MKIIDLNRCVKKDSKVLSGRDEGKKWRNEFNLENLDNSGEVIKVQVPEDLYSINPSFFLGLFGKSVRLLGVENFKKHYIFLCDEIIMECIEEDINRAVNEVDVLKGC